MSTADDHDPMSSGVSNPGPATARPLLIIHSSDEMYGSDRMVLELIDALSDVDRDRVVVWLPADCGHGPTPLCVELGRRGLTFEHVDLPVLRRRYLNVRGLAWLAVRAGSLRSNLVELDPRDIILATSATLLAAPVLGRGRSPRVTLYLQEVWQGPEGRALSALALRMDRVIAVSEATRRSLPERLRSRTVVVPNGTPEPPSFSPVDPGRSELVFLIASRWDPRKGHEVLLRAWDLAGCPGRLVILGSPSAMGAGVDVLGLVSSSSRPDTVDVRGQVMDVGGAIDAADFVLVPSTQPESFGLVAIEAFARGRAVVASAAGGLLETVADGAGWLVEPGDVQELAAVLRSLTREDAVRAGAAARRRYEQHYSLAAFRAAMRAALDMSAVESPPDGSAANHG